MCSGLVYRTHILNLLIVFWACLLKSGKGHSFCNLSKAQLGFHISFCSIRLHSWRLLVGEDYRWSIVDLVEKK